MADFSKWRQMSDRMIRCGYNMLANAEIRVTERGKTDVTILAAALLARTLSNARGALVLIGADRIVEARTMVRCCFENQFWIAGLAADGDGFADRMLQDEIIRQRQKARESTRCGPVAVDRC